MKSFLIFVIAVVSSVQLSAHSGNMIKSTFVEGLVGQYLEIQEALAADDLQRANASASDLAKKLNLEPNLNMKKPYIQMKKSAVGIKKAGDIANARESFADLSAAVLEMIPLVGAKLETPLYQAYCAMAFDGRGGAWLQAGQTVANPYYGKQMLRCGSLRSQVSGKQKSVGHGCCPVAVEAPQHKMEGMLTPASEDIVAEHGKNYPKVCIVSGDELVDGEIYDFAYKGKLVRFCCKGCKKDFMEEPEVYMEKLKKFSVGAVDKAESDHSKHEH